METVNRKRADDNGRVITLNDTLDGDKKPAARPTTTTTRPTNSTFEDEMDEKKIPECPTFDSDGTDEYGDDTFPMMGHVEIEIVGDDEEEEEEDESPMDHEVCVPTQVSYVQCTWRSILLLYY